MNYPKVMTEDETIDRALSGQSISRFGDGELRLALGRASVSQVAASPLRGELVTILRNKGPALVCIPNVHSATPNDRTWANYATADYVRLYGPGEFGSSFVTRPDSAPWIDRPDYWEKVSKLWADRDAVLVAGSPAKSFGAGALASARSVRLVIAPERDAYSAIDRLAEEIGKPSGPVLLCAGAAATVLAARLARRGVWALDLGHMGHFMNHKGAYSIGPDGLASPEYRDQLRRKHREIKWGNSGASWAGEVIAFADEIGAGSILDYGCGRGTLAEALKPKGRRVMEYDPGIPAKAILPKPADLIVSTDVLEHVEPDRVDAVLVHMFNLANKGAYLVISLRPARELLPDGRNAHLTVQPAEWWVDRIIAAGWKVDRTEVRKGLCVWATK